MSKINETRVEPYLDRVVEHEVAKLNYKEIVFARQLDKIKMKLHVNKHFDPFAAFKLVDDWGYGYIDQSMLKNFLRKHGFITKDLKLSDSVVGVMKRRGVIAFEAM